MVLWITKSPNIVLIITLDGVSVAGVLEFLALLAMVPMPGLSGVGIADNNVGLVGGFVGNALLGGLVDIKEHVCRQ